MQTYEQQRMDVNTKLVSNTTLTQCVVAGGYMIPGEALCGFVWHKLWIASHTQQVQRSTAASSAVQH
jgi:hypothetical protein